MSALKVPAIVLHGSGMVSLRFTLKIDIMKYPKDQYALLVRFLKEFSTRYDPSETDPNTLHYIIFQQGSTGQTHNHLYINRENGAITRQHNILDMTGFEKWLNVPETFELYPEGCNDIHIETAVKRAIKEIQGS